MRLNISQEREAYFRNCDVFNLKLDTNLCMGTKSNVLKYAGGKFG